MTSIKKIEGIGDVYADKFKMVGITSVEALLKAGATPKGREELAQRSGISGELILKWTNFADLFRIKGVGEEYSELLEAAGVDTVVELAQRKAENLLEKMAAVNEKKKLVRKMPVEKQVADWIAQAKKLPRVMTY